MVMINPFLFIPRLRLHLVVSSCHLHCMLLQYLLRKQQEDVAEVANHKHITSKVHKWSRGSRETGSKIIMVFQTCMQMRTENQGVYMSWKLVATQAFQFRDAPWHPRRSSWVASYCASTCIFKIKTTTTKETPKTISCYLYSFTNFQVSKA